MSADKVVEPIIESQEVARKRAIRHKLRRALPTDRATVAKQFDVLRAVAATSGAERKPVSNDEVARVASLHPGTISNCNPYFLESGLLTRVKMLNVPCDEVFSYAERYRWDGEKAAHKLAPVLRKTWFCAALLPKLAFSSLSIDDAVAYLADEAGATPDYRDQLSMLIEYLRAAGIVSVDGNSIKAVDIADPAPLPPSPLGNSDIPPPAVTNNGNDGNNIGLDLDPLLLALLRKIPAHGQVWPADKRLRWLRTFAMNVSQVYDEDETPVEMKIELEKDQNLMLEQLNRDPVAA